MRVLLFFPPLTDASAPYLALPSIKANLEARLPGVTATCVDLNRDFVVEEALGDGYAAALAAYRGGVQRGTPEEAIRASWDFHEWMADRARAWEARWPGHRLVLGNFGRYEAPGDAGAPEGVAAYAAGPTPFDDLYRRTLARYPAPDLVGMGMMVAWQLLPMARLSAVIREVWPQTRIAWGGAQLTRVVDAVTAPALAHLVDDVIVREGEDPLVEIARELLTGERATSPKILRSGGPAPSRRALRELPPDAYTDLATLAPPDFSDLDVHAYPNAVPTLPLMFSRKCYWGRCAFCDIPSTWDPRHRERPLDAVLAELRGAIERHGVRHFYVNDEAVPPALLRAVCERILAEGLDVRFLCTALLEKRFLDPSLVALFARAGGRLMQWGLEACDSATLRAMNKGINRVGRYEDLLGAFAAAGVHNLVYSVAGFPFGSEGADWTTAEYIRRERSIHSVLILAFGVERDAPLGRALEDSKAAAEGDAADATAAALAESKRRGIPAAVRRLYQELFGDRLDIATLATLGQEDRFALTVFQGADCAQRVDLERLLGRDVIRAAAGAPDAPHGPLLDPLDRDAVVPAAAASASDRSEGSASEPAPAPAVVSRPSRPAELALSAAGGALHGVAAALLAPPDGPLPGWTVGPFREEDFGDARGLAFRLGDGTREMSLRLYPTDVPGRGVFEGRHVRLLYVESGAPRTGVELAALTALGERFERHFAGEPEPARGAAAAVRSGGAGAPTAPAAPSDLASHAGLVRRVVERLAEAERSPLPGWRLMGFEERRDENGYAIVLDLARGDARLRLSLLPAESRLPACAAAGRVKVLYDPETPPSSAIIERGLPRLCRLLDHYLALAGSNASPLRRMRSK